LHDLHGSEVFATLDFCQGYWQIPLHKDSQDCQSFITPVGIYTPKRVLHGTRNATKYLQSVLVAAMKDIKSSIKIWLDDCLLHTKTEGDLFATLNFFVKQCQKVWIGSVRKQMCVVCNQGEVLLKVNYQGELLWKVDHQGLSTFQSKEYRSAAENAQAAEWCRLGTVCRGSQLDAKRDIQLLRLAPLQATLAKVFEGKSRRTKKAASTVSLLHLWGPEDQAVFKNLQAAIMKCFALLRIRPLSNSCAECSVVISCGKVDYDKSG
jgi:hypothetical protein